MATYNWHFARPALAKKYLNLFDVGLTAARSLFARRRMGKTEFLKKQTNENIAIINYSNILKNVNIFFKKMYTCIYIYMYIYIYILKIFRTTVSVLKNTTTKNIMKSCITKHIVIDLCCSHL